MNNEERIIAMLEKMDQRLDKLEAGQAKLLEDVTEIKSEVKYIWEDLDRLGKRLNAQDTVIKKIM